MCLHVAREREAPRESGIQHTHVLGLRLFCRFEQVLAERRRKSTVKGHRFILQILVLSRRKLSQLNLRQTIKYQSDPATSPYETESTSAIKRARLTLASHDKITVVHLLCVVIKYLLTEADSAAAWS